MAKSQVSRDMERILAAASKVFEEPPSVEVKSPRDGSRVYTVEVEKADGTFVVCKADFSGYRRSVSFKSLSGYIL